MGKPLISVIVPVYNAENYIYSCIESILSQTFTDFELILVDDGSQDGSGKICENYQLKDNRIRVIHQNNSGPSFARKTGFQNANGGYLCFIDSDDYIEKDYLKILYSKTTDNCDLVCSNCKDGHISADEYIRGLLLGKHGWEMWNKLFSKNAINDSVFNLPPKLKIGEDFIANILIAKNIKSVSLVTEPGYKHLYNENSLMNTNKISYEYETFFISEITKALGDLTKTYFNEYWRLLMIQWRQLVWNNVKAPSDSKWILWCKEQAKDIKNKTKSELVLLNIQNCKIQKIAFKLLHLYQKYRLK